MSAFVKNADRVLVIDGEDDFGGISKRSLFCYRFLCVKRRLMLVVEGKLKRRRVWALVDVSVL